LNLLNKNSGTIRLHIELPCTSFDDQIEKVNVKNNDVNILLTKENLNKIIFDETQLIIIQNIWENK
jgi:hypothetical protein